MDQQRAQRLLEQAGHSVDTITAISEGRSHDNFEVTLDSGEEVVVRFERATKLDKHRVKRDSHYGGVISLEREGYLCNFLRNELGIRTPKMRGPFKVDDERFLVAEKLTGKTWDQYLREHDYSLGVFLASLERLGMELAKAHRKTYEKFGDINPEGVQGPPQFTARAKQFIVYRLARLTQSPAYTEREVEEVNRFLERSLASIVEVESHITPVFTIADLHPRNILVDSAGNPSFPDVEWSQAGPVEQEMYLVHSLFTSYFDNETLIAGQEALRRGHQSEGGTYNHEGPLTQQLELLLRVAHTVGSAANYYGAEGFRREWSARFKDLAFQMIKTGKIDYVGHTDIFRSKTGQPVIPTRP